MVAATMRPPKAATQWSARRLAKEVGLNPATVNRTWQKYGLQPHRLEHFKFSTDPEIETKLADIVGLYLDPPERALVLCVDEKSQIQALNRTAPLLPLRPGIPAQMTHDYQRNGTTSLFAALEVISGKVHGRCYRQTSSAYEQYILDRATVEQYATELVGDASRVYKARLYTMEHGEASLLDVLDAHHTVNDVYLGYYGAFSAHAKSLISLEQASGIWDIDF